MDYIKKSLFIFLLAAIFFSCDKKEKTTVVKLDDFKTIKGSNKKSNSQIVYPHKIISFNDKFILSDLGDTHFFKIYNKNNLSFISSFGKKGGGPNELINPPMLLNHGDKFNFYFGNFFEKAIYKAEYKNDTFRIIKTYPLPESMFSKQDFLVVNDSIIIGTGGENDKLSIYNIASKEFNNIKLTDIDNNLKNKDRRNVFKSHISVNTEKNKIVLAYENIGLVEVYDFSLNLINRVAIGKSINDQIKNIELLKKDKSFFLASINIYSDSTSIYLIYVGKPYNSIDENTQDYVLVFDWDLRLKKIYKLDRFISIFTMFENNVMLGIDKYNEEEMFVKFHLK